MEIGKLVLNNRVALNAVLKAILPLDTFTLTYENTGDTNDDFYQSYGRCYYSADYQIEVTHFEFYRDNRNDYGDFIEIISYSGVDEYGEKIATAKIIIEVDTDADKTIAQNFIDAHIFVSQWKNFFQPVSQETKKLFSAFLN